MTDRLPLSPNVCLCPLLLLHLAACDPDGAPAAREGPQARPVATVRLSEERTLSIGLREGSDEYLFTRVSGGARLADGSVVVSDQGAYRIQKFGPEGEHLWSRGRKGEGPGEFEYVRLLQGCASAQSVVAYDIRTRRVTVLGGDGGILEDYPFVFEGLAADEIGCSPNGRLAFTGSGTELGDTALEPGTIRRGIVSLGFAERGDTEITVLREGIPDTEQTYLGSPGDYAPGSIWSHDAVFAATDDGVWLGTGDDYEVEFVDWTGATTRRIRWEGPDLTVTQHDIDRHRENLQERYRRRGDPDWRARFESSWEWESGRIPLVFPACNRLLLGDDGVLWIHDFIRTGEHSEWFAFTEDGRWVRSLVLPPRTRLFDIGPDWALVLTLDDQDVQRLAVHTLVEN